MPGFVNLGLRGCTSAHCNVGLCSENACPLSTSAICQEERGKSKYSRKDLDAGMHFNAFQSKILEKIQKKNINPLQDKSDTKQNMENFLSLSRLHFIVKVFGQKPTVIQTDLSDKIYEKTFRSLGYKIKDILYVMIGGA